MVSMRRRGLPLAVLAALFAAAAAGCGGSHTQHTQVRTRPPSAGPYRWLVQTEGAQPTIAAENRNPGTPAWRLPGPAADVGGVAHGDISGYVSQQAVRPGQIERIYVNAPGARAVRIRIFRIGWYGGAGGREVLVSRLLPAVPQPPCTHRFQTGLTECNWHPTLSFTIPSALPSGVYIAKLSAASTLSSTTSTRRDRPVGRPGSRMVFASCTDGSKSTGSFIVNSHPFSNPALDACNLPSCISTRLRARARPIPNPP